MTQLTIKLNDLEVQQTDDTKTAAMEQELGNRAEYIGLLEKKSEKVEKLLLMNKVKTEKLNDLEEKL